MDKHFRRRYLLRNVPRNKSQKVGNSECHPDTNDLQTHEIAMNVTDKKIYTKAADGSIVTIASHNPDQLTTEDLLAFSIALG